MVPAIRWWVQEGGESRLAEARSAATSAIDALQLSDAPLLHPPGLLALAAMKNGLRVLSKVSGPHGAGVYSGWTL
jgi:hypothetical protein